MKCKNPRERIRLVCRYLDALERDFLDAYPDEIPVFKDGLEKEFDKQTKITEI